MMKNNIKSIFLTFMDFHEPNITDFPIIYTDISLEEIHILENYIL